jgi:hypothetical protein
MSILHLERKKWPYLTNFYTTNIIGIFLLWNKCTLSTFLPDRTIVKQHETIKQIAKHETFNERNNEFLSVFHSKDSLDFFFCLENGSHLPMTKTTSYFVFASINAISLLMCTAISLNGAYFHLIFLPLKLRFFSFKNCFLGFEKLLSWQIID